MATAISLLPAAVWGGAGTRNPGRLLFIAVARAPATAEGAAQGMAQKGVESLRAEREVVVVTWRARPCGFTTTGPGEEKWGAVICSGA